MLKTKLPDLSVVERGLKVQAPFTEPAPEARHVCEQLKAHMVLVQTRRKDVDASVLGAAEATAVYGKEIFCTAEPSRK